MYDTVLEPLDAPSIIERIDHNTPELGYDDWHEMERYGGKPTDVAFYPSKDVLRVEAKPHWHEEGAYSHVSIVGMRNQNEDASVGMLAHGVFAIFDGWGGRSRSHQAALFLKREIEQRGLFAVNHPKDKGDMMVLFNRLTASFNKMNDSPKAAFGDAYVTPYFAQERITRGTEPAGTTAVIAVVNPRRNTVTVGNVGDSECYVFDTHTGTLAKPPRFESHDMQTGQKIADGGFAAATVPHGLGPIPVYDKTTKAVTQFATRLAPSDFEVSTGPPLFVEDAGMREYEITKAWMGGREPRLQMVGRSSRLLGAPDPRRSLGEIDGDWTRTYGEKEKPMQKPEIFTWTFEEGFDGKWLFLCCDGVQNNEAFRGPKSICAFLMDPYTYLANETEHTGNYWLRQVDKLPADGEKAKQALWRHTAEMRRVADMYASDAPPIGVQRPLLRTYFDLLYRLHAAAPDMFWSEKETADAIHQATLFFAQWTEYGKIGGLRGSPDDMHATDLISALVFFTTLQQSTDNVSASLVNLSDLH
jgi:serine/threonine protein phosphatase PrpC